MLPQVCRHINTWLLHVDAKLACCWSSLCFLLGAHLSLQQSRGHYADVQQALVKKVYYWQEQHSSCSDSSSLHLALSPKSCHFVHKFFTKHLAALLRSRNLAYFGVEIFLIHCGQWAIVIHSFKWKISRVCVRKYKFFFFFFKFAMNVNSTLLCHYIAWTFITVRFTWHLSQIICICSRH